MRHVYDPGNGKLTMVAFAADGSLRIDHWCEMDGERLLRMEKDDDGDGVAGPREHLGRGRIVRTELMKSGNPLLPRFSWWWLP